MWPSWAAARAATRRRSAAPSSAWRPSSWTRPIALDALRKWKAERVVGKLARGLAAVAKSKGVDVVGGRGVFEDSRVLRVEGDEPQKIRFQSAVVATGSAPSPLP